MEGGKEIIRSKRVEGEEREEEKRGRVRKGKKGGRTRKGKLAEGRDERGGK